MLHPTLSRGELETKVEAEMLSLCDALYGDQAEDLQKAHDYDPAFFGGEFPAEGAWVRETRGTGEAQDRGDRPSVLEAVLCFYYPALPVTGLKSKSEDRQQLAKRVTRTLRDRYLLEMKNKNARLYAAISSIHSRAGAADEFGVARTDFNSRGQPQNIIWVDRTIIEFSV